MKKIIRNFIGINVTGLLLVQMVSVSATPEISDGNIFKCTNKQGEVYYNDKPCPVEDEEKRIRSEKDVVNGYVPPGSRNENFKQRVGVSVGGNTGRELGNSQYNNTRNSTTSSQNGAFSGSGSSEGAGSYDASIKSVNNNALNDRVTDAPKPKIIRSASGEQFTVHEKKSMLGISPQVK